MDRDIENYLHSIYYNPKHNHAFSSPYNFFKFVQNDQKYHLKLTDIKRWLEKQDIYSLYVNKKKPRNLTPVVSPYPNYQYDIDSAMMPVKSKTALKYFILAIDVFSRKISAKGVKNLKAATVKQAISSIFHDMGVPEHLRSDRGVEYTNNLVKQFLIENGVSHFYAYPPNKANFAERAIRTIKSKLYKQMISKGLKQWTNEMLQETVQSYNNSYHRMIGMSPNSVNNLNVEYLWYKLNKDHLKKGKFPHEFSFQLNEPVRIALFNDSGFEKEHTEQFSSQIYFISDRYAPFNVERYRVKSEDNIPLLGSFTVNELQKVNLGIETNFQIDRIIMKRKMYGREYYKVKWKGYSDLYNSWILKSALEKHGDENTLKELNENFEPQQIIKKEVEPEQIIKKEETTEDE